VRATLRRHAARVAAGVPLHNPRLDASHGTAPLFDQTVTVLSKRKPAATWRPEDDGSQVLEIQPGDFAAARWERLGTWDGGTLVHAYGSESGYFEYQFELPAGRTPKELTVRARLSSEYPGTVSPPEGYSRVRLLIDGVRVADVVAMADDGIGRWYEITALDPALLGRLRAGVHVLRFEVPPGPDARGVAIYGPNTGKGEGRVRDGGPIQLRLLAD
jgi:hypothetical protein